MNTYLRWISVLTDGTVNFIAPEKKYLVIAGVKADGTTELTPNNILTEIVNYKYLDTLSAESDYFTRLLALTKLNMDGSNLRTGRSNVGLFTQIQIIEYTPLPVILNH